MALVFRVLPTLTVCVLRVQDRSAGPYIYHSKNSEFPTQVTDSFPKRTSNLPQPSEANECSKPAREEAGRKGVQDRRGDTDTNKRLDLVRTSSRMHARAHAVGDAAAMPVSARA